MELIYKDEYIINHNGIECCVLDTSMIDFSSADLGRKKVETIVLRANGGEKIDTLNSLGLVGTKYITNVNDAIFCNSETDMYVPRDGEGKAWSFDKIEEYGYEKTSDYFQYAETIGIKVKSTKTAKVLPEVIIKPTCIKDAWGKDNHQFLFKGATLKLDPDNARITGIDKEAFDNTWEIIRKSKRIK